MPYIDKYKEYLNKLPENIQQCEKSGKKMIFGYTSNLDVLIEWDTDIFNELLMKYLKEEPVLKKGEVLDSMESFARIVSYYVMHGLGGEIDITNIEICNYIEKNFKTEFALGGTCAQGAAAISAMGFSLIAHITDKSKQVCELMRNENIQTVIQNDIKHISACVTKELPARHMILQYTKGDVIKVLGKEIIIPVSNRLIMDYDEIHKILPIDKEFLEYCEKNANKIFFYNVSGFNAMIDMDILKQRIEELGAHYTKVKSKNPNCIIYLEGAHYFNEMIKDYVFNKMAAYADILGMNEEELVGFSEQVDYNIDKDNLESVLLGLELVIKRYPVMGIVMHTKDYSMYYGEKVEHMDIEKGLTIGNLMSGTRARTGKYGSYEECEESLALPLSDAGLDFARKLETLPYKRYVCIVPSRYMEKPKYTIGLGDTFVAGMQMGFIK